MHVRLIHRRKSDTSIFQEVSTDFNKSDNQLCYLIVLGTKGTGLFNEYLFVHAGYERDIIDSGDIWMFPVPDTVLTPKNEKFFHLILMRGIDPYNYYEYIPVFKRAVEKVEK